MPAARRFALSQLGAVSGDVRDVVAVMVSELATNALLHADTAFVVDVVVDDGVDEIVVAVHDGGDGQPVVQDPDPTDTHGRGLRIVASLADRWGTGRSDQEPGTVVWFAVRRTRGVGSAPGRPGGAAEEHPPVWGTTGQRFPSTRRRRSAGVRPSCLGHRRVTGLATVRCPRRLLAMAAPPLGAAPPETTTGEAATLGA